MKIDGLNSCELLAKIMMDSCPMLGVEHVPLCDAARASYKKCDKREVLFGLSLDMVVDGQCSLMSEEMYGGTFASEILWVN
jgi:hypothetical protein